LGHAVYESGDRLSHIYLPTTAVVSTLHVMENGTSAEIAVTRRDGLSGVTMFMGGETRPGRAIVQSGGEAYKLGADVVRQEFARGGAVRQLLLRYTQTLITPIARTAACTLYHSIAQQFCRCLLLTLDGVEPNEIRMTQELIANMPGVRHAGVAEAAARLPNEAIIRNRHGIIEGAGAPARHEAEALPADASDVAGSQQVPMRDDRGNPAMQFVPVHLQEQFRQAGGVGCIQRVMQRKKRFGLRIHHVGEALACFRVSHAGCVRIDDGVRQLFADVAERHALSNLASRAGGTPG
jgi:CRP-like cAMP-binding protein